MGYVHPFSTSTITSRFGETAGRSNPHRGLDYAPGGPAVGAIEAGTVVRSEYQSCLGNVVVVAHAGGIYSGYSHLAQRDVGVGARVAQGQRLGVVGNTGSCSAGRHLHLTISTQSNNPSVGQVQDPYAFINEHSGGGSAGGGGAPADFAYGLSKDAQYNAQRALAHYGRYAGPTDGVFGQGSVSALQQFLVDVSILPKDYAVDGIPGPTYGKALQTLASKHGYTGPIDGAPGEATSKGIIAWGYFVLGQGTPAPAPSPSNPAGVDWKAWQTFLAAYGYAGPADGAPGKNTYAALQKFLAEKAGYTGPVDGEPGEKTWAAFATAVAAGYPSKGTAAPAPAVDWAKWQTFLKAYGYDGPVDGQPGKNTYLALQKFLATTFGYTGPQDGEPGQFTWEALTRAVNSGYPGNVTTPPVTTPPVTTPPVEVPSTGTSFGIDVATSQRGIDFAKAKAEGVQFVIVKMGGLNVKPQYVAPHYKTQIDGAKAQGLPVGHYYLIGAGETPEQQAEYFVKNLYRFNKDTDILALDNEKLDDNGAVWGQDEAERFFKKVIELTGIAPQRLWLYAGAADFRGRKPWTKITSLGVRFWWAAYGSYPTGKTPDHEPSLQGAIPEAHVHQYSSKVSVAGFALDGNYSKYSVNDLFGKVTETTPPVTEPETPEEPTTPTDPGTTPTPTPGSNAWVIAALVALGSTIATAITAIINALSGQG